MTYYITKQLLIFEKMLIRAEVVCLKILVSIPEGEIRQSFFPPEVCDQLEALGDVVWNTGSVVYTSAQLAQAIADVDVVFTGWGTPALTQDVIKNARRLRIMAHTGGSVAGYATPELYAAGVRVLSGNEIYATSVAEGTIAYMLTALRRLPYFMDMVKTKGWHSGMWYNEGLLGQTVGIVEFGSVARQLVRLLKPFGVHIKVCAGHVSQEEALALGVEKASIEELFETCHIVTLHGASGPNTYHMINCELLERMQQGAIFVNTARGSLVDEAALAMVLTKRPDLQAILDVYEVEPLPTNSPLRQLPNAYIVPHMAGPTIDRRPLVTMGLINDIRLIEAGNTPQLEITAQRARFMSE